MKRKEPYKRNLRLFFLGAVLLGGLVVAVGICGQVTHAKAMTLVHPTRIPPAGTPADYGVEDWELVSFSSSDGLQLVGWFIPPGPQGDGAVLIFVHGLGGNREGLMSQAAMLGSHGYGALLLDLRNHGQSEGTVTTLGYEEVKDVQGAVSYLLTRPEVDAARIGLVGHSMGGGTAIRAAARIPQVRAVVAQSAYVSIEDNIAQGVQALTGLPPFPFAPLLIWFGEREAGVRIQQVRPVDDVAQIAPRAIMFVHGELDDLVPVRNSLALYQAAGEPKALYLIPGASHYGFMAVEPERFEQRMSEFLDIHLRGD